MITLTPRPFVPWQFVLAVPFLAVALTVIIGAVIFALLGFDPSLTLYEFFIKHQLLLT